MGSRDAGDEKKRDREKWRSPETLGTLGTGKKRLRETERSERERENSKFKFKQLAGKFWFLGTLGTRKKETEINGEV